MIRSFGGDEWPSENHTVHKCEPQSHCLSGTQQEEAHAPLVVCGVHPTSTHSQHCSCRKHRCHNTLAAVTLCELELESA